MNKFNLKAILFDFMGVLLFPKIKIKTDEIRDDIDRLIGQVTDDQKFKTETLKKYKLSESEFSQILEKIIVKYERFEPLWKLLPDLRKKYKLAVINNGTALTLPSLYKLHQIDKYFDLFVSSAQEGVKKPSPEIFLLTCNKLKVEPIECLFMDDNLENVEAAEKLGMQTIHWIDKESGLKFMKQKLDLNN